MKEDTGYQKVLFNKWHITTWGNRLTLCGHLVHLDNTTRSVWYGKQEDVCLKCLAKVKKLGGL